MIVQLCLLLVFCTGSVLCCSYFDKKFEEALPLTLTALVLVLFGCSLVGYMLQGVYLVLALCVVGYLCAGVHLVRTGRYKAVALRFFTPSFFIFATLMLLLTYFNSGKVASSWDEFSHWADVVKMMTQSHLLSTSALSNSLFQSYPPGMALLQYFVQQIYVFFHPAESFNEWRMFFAYQIFAISFFMPLCKHFTYKRSIFAMFAVAVVAIGVMFVFPEAFITIYVDLFLGVLTGVGFAIIYLTPKKDSMAYLNVLACIAMLVLAKDSGLMFAAFLAIALLVDGLGFGAFSFAQTASAKWASAAGALAALCLPKLLWSWNISLTGAEVRFSAPIEYDVLWQIVRYGGGESYQITCYNNFIDAFFTQGLTLVPLDVTVPYAVLLGLFVLVCVLLWAVARYAPVAPARTQAEIANPEIANLTQTEPTLHEPAPRPDTRRLVLVPVVLLVQTVVFVLGMGVSYLFKFNATEAVQLSSYTRYMATAYLPLCLVCLFGLLQLVRQRRGMAKYLVVVCLLVGSVASVQKAVVIPFVTRSQILASMTVREPYLALEEKLETLVQADSNIYFISQQDTGLHALVVRYLARPFASFEIAALNTPYYEGETLIEPMSAQQVQALLQASYDYVVIYQLDDYFIEEYASLFADASQLQENSIYAVDASTGLLTLLG